MKTVKILGISLSARQSSNSSLLLRSALNYFRHPKFESLLVEQIDLAQATITCPGCESCYASLDAHQDDITTICSKMVEANAIIFSTPTHYGMPPAIGKTLLERTDPLWLSQMLKNKIGGAIVNGASSYQRLERCKENLQAYFDAHGMLVVPQSPCIGNTKYLHEDRLLPTFTDTDDKQIFNFCLRIQNLLALKVQTS